MANNDPKGKDDKPLVKARHDNSVLFSLKDLDGGGAPKGGEGNTGAAQNDSSGFINLNAIAASSQYVANSEGGDAAMAPQVMPAMVPMGRPKEGKGVLIAISIAAVILVGVIVALVIVVLNKDTQPTTIIQQVPVPAPTTPGSTPPPDGNAAGAADKKDDPAEEKKDDAEEKKDDAAEENKDDGASGEAGDDKGADKATDKGAKKTGAAAGGNGGTPPADDKGDGAADKAEDDKAGETPEKETPPPADDKGKGKATGGNINDILDDLAGGGGGAKTPNNKSGGNAGDNADTGGGGKTELTKADVKNTIDRYGSQIAACGGPGKAGIVLVRFAVLSNGSVGSATVTGDKAGTPEGNCVAAAVRGFKFPAFSGATKTITYPFRL